MEKELIEIAIYENLNDAKVENFDGLCFYFSNNIKHDLEIMEISVNIWNIRNLTGCNYDHYFLVAGDDDKYLIDVTFSQFLEKKGEIPIVFADFPANNLLQSNRGKIILKKLIDSGYIKMESDDFDIYLNCFTPKERKKIR